MKEVISGGFAGLSPFFVPSSLPSLGLHFCLKMEKIRAALSWLVASIPVGQAVSGCRSDSCTADSQPG